MGAEASAIVPGEPDAPVVIAMPDQMPGATALLHNRAFLTLWGGQSVSVFGTQITQFALPWLVLDLNRSAAIVGALSAVSFLPYLLFALPAGVIADHWNRRAIMLVCDAARGLIVISIPVASFMGVLTLVQLFVVAALLRFFTIFFDVGYTACLPNLVEKRQLADANGKLEMTRSAAELSGQPLAGVLVALFSAAGTLVIDTASYVVSFLSLATISRPFSAPTVRREDGTFWQRMVEGVRFVAHHRLIRALAVTTAIGNLATSAITAVLIYRSREELHFNAAETGIFLASVAIGQFFASLVVGKIARRVAFGRQILLATIFQPLVPLAFALTGNLVVMTSVGIVWGVGVTLLNIPMIALRQTVIPDHLLGRVSAAMRMIAWCTIPIGGLAGGLIAAGYGARTTFLCAAVILALAVGYIATSPIPKAGNAEY
ncbi:MAG: MFS transporter [Chloroflexota bacterium]|nr:MFS transporter [Chloroflexota bacterium]